MASQSCLCLLIRIIWVSAVPQVIDWNLNCFGPILGIQWLVQVGTDGMDFSLFSPVRVHFHIFMWSSFPSYIHVDSYITCELSPTMVISPPFVWKTSSVASSSKQSGFSLLSVPTQSHLWSTISQGNNKLECSLERLSPRSFTEVSRGGGGHATRVTSGWEIAEELLLNESVL